MSHGENPTTFTLAGLRFLYGESETSRRGKNGEMRMNEQP